VAGVDSEPAYLDYNAPTITTMAPNSGSTSGLHIDLSALLPSGPSPTAAELFAQHPRSDRLRIMIEEETNLAEAYAAAEANAQPIIVALHGTNFGLSTPAVLFGTVRATVIEANHTYIAFQVPPTAGVEDRTSLNVRIVAPADGAAEIAQSSDSASWSFTAPEIANIVPRHGPTDGCIDWERGRCRQKSTITLYGTSLGGVSIKLGEEDCLPLPGANATHNR
jgi:hypothetical protein